LFWIVAEHKVERESLGRLAGRCIRVSHTQVAIQLVNLILSSID
jgi:hypothetical protein